MNELRHMAQTEPAEARECWSERLAEIKRQFMASEISHAVFVASLYALGFRNAELEAERRLAEHAKFEATGSWT